MSPSHRHTRARSRDVGFARVHGGAPTRAASTAAVLLLLVLASAGCIHDGRLKIPYNDTPRPLDDGWPIAVPESLGMDGAKLRQAYELFFSEHDFVPARSLLVVRRGALVAEAYCRDLDDISRIGALMSATKSVTSLLTGIAIDNDGADSLDRTLYSLIPGKFDTDSAKRRITLRHLLTMRSGIDFDNDHFSLEMDHDVHGDGIAHVLHKPLLYQPGTTYNYQDCDPHLMSAALQEIVGMTLDRFAQERLFRPIGISKHLWLAHHDGTTYGGYGLYLTPRDMARIGKLVLQSGRWEGRQVIPEGWIRLSTARQTEMDAENARLGFDYGFYWWRVPELAAFTAYGHGGQYIFVAPAQELVIVLTAEPDTDIDTVAITLPQFLVLARTIVDAAGLGAKHPTPS
jgi:CubicO group peptidase (beta-lactamase class C family)